VRSTCAIGALASGQINKTDLAASFVCLPWSRWVLNLSPEGKGEDRVRPRGRGIHVCRGGGPRLRANLQQVHDLSVIFHRVGGEVLHEDALLGILSDPEVVRWGLVGCWGGREEVPNLLIVDFVERYCNARADKGSVLVHRRGGGLR